jgi:hypothetical protein
VITRPVAAERRLARVLVLAGLLAAVATALVAAATSTGS